MKSLLTNSSALTAIQNLNYTNRSMEVTQTRISTGMRVTSAADNAAYWSIATTMRSDNSALSTVKDALGIGTATLDVVMASLKSGVDIIGTIKAKLVAARQPGVDRTKVQAEITQLQKQMFDNANSASFNGENWIVTDATAAGYNPLKQIVASFSRAGGAIVIGTIDIDLATQKLYDTGDQSGIIDKSRTVGTVTDSVATLDISALTDSPADLQTLDDLIALVDQASGEVNQSATEYGQAKRRVDSQKDFIDTLMSSITRGVGELVDADMTEESTRLQALQTQTQLGVQSLSIANSTHQLIMKLFGG